MKIDEQNVVQQVKLKNEQALVYIIEQYGGLPMEEKPKNLTLIPYLTATIQGKEKLDFYQELPEKAIEVEVK
ncbi:hypothetical protein [Brevibacillus daliensis]|uniref:hypothetical protein n=1 Tax=Brevibacillus daliensis TaxID=2892995 RepID=UPI001E403A20|nr:hypothetical protein [Brevibacillus daliensis]